MTPCVAGGRRGQSLVEFALVLPIFAIMLFGIIDFGRYVYTANTLGNGAREAARIGSVGNRPPECDGLARDTCVKTVAQDRAWGVLANVITTTVTCERISPTGDHARRSSPCASGDLLRVQTTYVLHPGHADDRPVHRGHPRERRYQSHRQPMINKRSMWARPQREDHVRTRVALAHASADRSSSSSPAASSACSRSRRWPSRAARSS